MARTKADLNSGTRLADYLAASLLARVFPATQVNLALDAHDANSKRIRRFPAVAGAYFTIALSLYPDCSYEAVFSAVAQGLAWAAGAQTPQPVSKSSISELRSRIGADPLRDLMRTCCLPLSDTTRQLEAFYRGLRVVAMDGTRMERPTLGARAAAPGRPATPRPKA
jgi:Insertion element 4 transposase N-terminal